MERRCGGCGGAGDSCCSSNRCTAPQTVCDTNQCQVCGNPGALCCAANQRVEGYPCNDPLCGT